MVLTYREDLSLVSPVQRWFISNRYAEMKTEPRWSTAKAPNTQRLNDVVDYLSNSELLDIQVFLILCEVWVTTGTIQIDIAENPIFPIRWGWGLGPKNLNSKQKTHLLD